MARRAVGCQALALPHCLIKNPHERNSVPHRNIHTNGQRTMRAEVGGDGAYHGSTQGGHQRDGQPIPTRQQATEGGDARSVRQAARLHRNHAGWLLRMWGKTVFERRDGELVKIVVGQRRPRRQSRRIYDEQVLAALRKIWYPFGCLCGKRLVAVLRTQLPVLESWRSMANSPWTPARAGSSRASAPPPSTGCCAPRNARCGYGVARIPSRPRA